MFSRSKPGVAKQRRYQDKQRAAGNCIMCGKPREEDRPGHTYYRSYCRFHGGLRRLYDQKRLKFRGWNKGKRGMPPHDIPVVSREQLEKLLGRNQ